MMNLFLLASNLAGCASFTLISTTTRFSSVSTNNHPLQSKSFEVSRRYKSDSLNMYSIDSDTTVVIDGSKKRSLTKLNDSPADPSPRTKRREEELIMSKEILGIFSLEDVSLSYKSMELGLYFIRNRPRLRRVHVLHILHESAKARINLDTIIPLTDLADILRDSVHPMRAAELGKLMHSLHMFNDKTPGIINLLDIVIVKIRSCTAPLTGYEMGNILYGLQGFSTTPQLRVILSSLLPAVIACEQLSGQEMGNAMYGLRSLDSSPEALLIISALAKLIDRSACSPVSAQTIANSLNGLKSQRSHPSVMEVLSAIARKMRESRDEFNGAAIGASFIGLQGLSDAPAVREVLQLLAARLQTSPSPLSVFALSQSLLGLQNMCDDVPEVRLVLAQIAHRFPLTPSPDMRPVSISISLYGLRKMNGRWPETKAVLTAINRILILPSTLDNAAVYTDTPADMSYSAKDVAKAIYGLQGICVNRNTDAKELLGKLAVLLSECDRLSAFEIGMTMFGLKAQTDANQTEVRAVLAVLAKRIPLASGFTGQSLTMSCRGLRGLSSNVKEVPQILLALIPHLNKIEIDARGIGNILYSLQSMYCTRPEVRLFLNSMVPKIRSCTNRRMSAQEISNSLWGLQGMNTDQPEVRNVVRAIVEEHLEPNTETFTAQAVALALGGMQTMSYEAADALRLVGALASKVRGCREIMSPEQIGRAMFGLQGFTSDYPEVREALAAITVKMDECLDKFEARDIGYCLSGLSGMTDDCVESINARNALVRKVSNSDYANQNDVLFLQFGKGIRIKKV